MKNLDLIKVLLNLRKDWTITDYTEAYADVWTEIPTDVEKCHEAMDEYIRHTYEPALIVECIENELEESHNKYKAKVQSIMDESEEKLKPIYIEYIKNKVDSLVGVTFSTGHLDDMHQIDEVVDDEVDGLTLIVFYTWEGESGDKNGIGLEELGCDQLQEIFDDITKQS